jgi:hypothetical protein
VAGNFVIPVPLAEGVAAPVVPDPPDPPKPGDPYLPIVPGLFSFGTDTTAGRGSQAVYRVTNLNASGSGSLAAALANNGPKVIIFEVSGMIELSAYLNIGSGSTIIAGQTAPDPGIWIYGAGLINNGSDDVLLQHLTLAPGDLVDPRVPTLVQADSNNVIIDHCTCLWGLSDASTAWGSNISNVSYSHCIFAESMHKTSHDLTENSRGLTVGNLRFVPRPVNIGVTKCLFAHNYDDNPNCFDIYLANNVIYNAEGSHTLIRPSISNLPENAESVFATVVGNVYKQGPRTNTALKPIVLHNCDDNSEIFVEDNKCSWIADTGDNFNDLCSGTVATVLANVKSTNAPVSMAGYDPLAGLDTESYVLLNAGARPGVREANVLRIIDDVTNGTGFFKASVELGGFSGADGSGPVPGGKPAIANNSRTLAVPQNWNFIEASGYSTGEEWLHAADFTASVPEPSLRNIRAEFTFARGSISNATASPDADGIYRDFGFIFGCHKWGSPITITAVNKSVVPAIATYSGTIVDPGSGGPAPGYTLDPIVLGMTEMSGRLIRPKNISGNTFEMWQDGNDAGYNPGGDYSGNTPVNATSYSSWQGSVSAQAHKWINNADKTEWLEIGSDEYPGWSVQEGLVTPPNTVAGAAQPVSAYEGNRFYTNEIDYWIDHSRNPLNSSGLDNSGFNNPRNALLWADSAIQIQYGQRIFLGFAVMLPSNFDQTTVTRTDDLSETGIIEIEDHPSVAQRNLFTMLITRHSGDPGMSWTLDASLTGVDSHEEIKLADVAGDIGLWTHFVFEILPHPSNGVFKIHKSTGPYLSGFERADTLIFERVGLPVGFVPTFGDWSLQVKQYKHAWHNFTGTGQSYKQWLAWDSIRWGSFEADGSQFRDVHRYLHDEPGTVTPADYIIPLGTTTFNASAVQPGEIIEIAGGTRGRLRIDNVAGALGNRITIRSSKDQKTIIRLPTPGSGDFVVRMQNCTHWDFDGTYTDGEEYGIKIMHSTTGVDSSTSYMQMWRICSDYAIRGVEVDGGFLAGGSDNGIGIQHNDGSITFQNPVDQLWRENILIEQCKIYDVQGEGIYLGSNYGASEHDVTPLRNIEVRFNDVRFCGRDCIQVKSTLEGDNSIHDNITEESGTRTDEGTPNQKPTISYFEGSGDVYNNISINAGEHGINQFVSNRPNSQSLPPFRAWNNLVIRPGIFNDDANTQPGDGISSGASAGGAVPEYVEITYNTVIGAEQAGVEANSSIDTPVTIRNNLLLDCPQAINDNSSGTKDIANNQTGSVAGMNFVDQANDDYHLTSSSPARNNASGVSPATDLDGIERPRGGTADQGCYEFVE